MRGRRFDTHSGLRCPHSSEHAELGRSDQLAHRVQARSGDGDRIVDFVGRDRVVVPWVGVLGLVTPPPEAVDRLESSDARKLGTDCLDYREVTARRCRAKPLVREERRRRLASSVIRKRERTFWIVPLCCRRRSDVASGRGDQSSDGVGISGDVLESARVEHSLDGLSPLVPPRHDLEDTEPRPSAKP
jgi:hypothetical protein